MASDAAATAAAMADRRRSGGVRVIF